jgi:hypothetical protein
MNTNFRTEVMIECDVCEGAFSDEWVYKVPLSGNGDLHEGAAPTSAVVFDKTKKPVGVKARMMDSRHPNFILYVPGGDVISVDRAMVKSLERRTQPWT